MFFKKKNYSTVTSVMNLQHELLTDCVWVFSCVFVRNLTMLAGFK